MSETPTDIAPDEPIDRKLVFVVGSGRSGTSTLSGTLQALGVQVPQPEVQADPTNPKGFGEPQWAVDFHHDLLQRVGVQVSDARPGAWFDAGRIATNDDLRTQLAAWLEGQFAEQGPEMVIKDPRLVWFLGLWRAAALRCNATPTYATMLRPVTEVVGSKKRYYTGPHDEVSHTAAWVNLMLHTERSTRDGARVFVRYGDLLSDWTAPVYAMGERLDLVSVRNAPTNDIRKVHGFIDPDLRRVTATWDDIVVPARLREIADETWRLLDLLVDPANDTPQTHLELDEVREAYVTLYDESAAIVQSSLVAQRRMGASRALAEQSNQAAAPGWRQHVPESIKGPARRILRRG